MSTEKRPWPKPSVRVIALDRQERGEIGERVAAEVLYSLGYSDLEQLSDGARQIDVIGRHRVEGHLAIAEAKATRTPIGGPPVDQMVGRMTMLSREPAIGRLREAYVISLGGFTAGVSEDYRRKFKYGHHATADREASAVQGRRKAGAPATRGKRQKRGPARQGPTGSQWVDARWADLHLINGERTVELLADGRMVVPAIEAIAKAVALTRADESHITGIELVAYGDGWAWAVYLGSQGKARQLALVHGPTGDALERDTAETLRTLEPNWRNLRLAQPETIEAPETERARERYARYMETAFGTITFEGVAVDRYAAALRPSIDEVYVPLRLWPVRHGDDAEREPPTEYDGFYLGEALARSRLLAIVAPPGGGKTTMLKRLAVAYGTEAGPDGQELERKTWLPFFVQCRQIEGAATRPIIEILKDLGRRAQLGESQNAFEALLSHAIQHSEALVMFDGLDEMPERERLALSDAISVFANSNRGVQVVVTARPAGFRAALPRLASFNLHAIAPLSSAEIERFVFLWQRSLDGDSEETHQRAREILRRLRATPRALQLARNPLMLTTLLLVRRGGGDLPERRSALYDETLRVLLSSWNVEGHQPIRREQAIPLLAWLSFEMTSRQEVRIPESDLNNAVRRAVQAMPEFFSYDPVTPERFAENIELRSSILINVGRELIDGRLQTVYEFRHLTLQEYLAAIAISDGHCEPRVDGSSIADTVRPYLGDDSWQEILPLVAVRLGRRSSVLLREMIAIVRGESECPPGGRREVVNAVLTQCLVDQVITPPDVISQATDAVFGLMPPGRPQLEAIAAGPYAQPLANAAAGCVANDWRLEEAANALGAIVQTATHAKGSEIDHTTWDLPPWAGPVLASYWAIEYANDPPSLPVPRTDWSDVTQLLGQESPGLRVLGARRVAVSARRGEAPTEGPDLVETLYALWQGDTSDAVRRSAAAALATVLSCTDAPIPDDLPDLTPHRMAKRLRVHPSTTSDAERAAALALGRRFRLWTEEELAELTEDLPAGRWSALAAEIDASRKAAES